MSRFRWGRRRRRRERTEDKGEGGGITFYDLRSTIFIFEHNT